MKRIFAVFLTSALLLSCFYIPVMAVGTTAKFTLSMNRLTGSAATGFAVGDAIGANDKLALDEYVLLTLGTDADKVSEYQVTVNFDSDILAYSSELERDSHYSNGYSVRDTLTEEWSSKTSNLQDDGKSIITGGAHDANSTVKSFKTTALIYFVFRVKTSAADTDDAKLFWLSEDDATKAKIGYRDAANKTVQYTPDLSAEARCGIAGVGFTLTLNQLTGSPDKGFTAGKEIGADAKLKTGDYVLLTLGTDAPKVSEYQVTINFNSDVLTYQGDLGAGSGYNNGSSTADTLTSDWGSKAYMLQSDGKSIIAAGADSYNSTPDSYGTTALIRFVFQVRLDANDATGVMVVWLSENTETRAKLGYHNEVGQIMPYAPDISAALVRDIATYTLGDVNDDGEIDVSDASAILDHVVKRRILTGNDFFAADVTKDGGVDVSDASRILDYVVKRITSFD
ncbi:MAG: dockerin type I repeat-containing protein [Oscillospiraceae bacterium]|nr:dockerin type I repeat-containing protein [Oscillospiraceae bacterium]